MIARDVTKFEFERYIIMNVFGSFTIGQTFSLIFCLNFRLPEHWHSSATLTNHVNMAQARPLLIRRQFSANH